MSSKVAVRAGGMRISAWNFVLLVPLLMLITPWFNFDKPRLLGMPFFYWYQFLFVLVGIVSVILVYVTTKQRPADTGKEDRLTVDELDEGEQQ